MDMKTPGRKNQDEKPLESGYPAEKARQGTIILKHQWQRVVFIAGLVAVILLAIAWPYLSAR